MDIRRRLMAHILGFLSPIICDICDKVSVSKKVSLEETSGINSNFYDMGYVCIKMAVLYYIR